MTTTFSPASQMMLRHASFFSDRHVIFAGDIQDSLPVSWDAKHVRAHLTAYQHYQKLVSKMGDDVEFSAVPSEKLFHNMNTLIYYWPKNKREAHFQLTYLRALLPEDSDIFIVGENRSGIRSCEKLLREEGKIKKIDTARRCSLYHFSDTMKPIFDLTPWWHTYTLADHTQIKTLPGVFSSEHLDEGSRLLLHTLYEHPQIVKGHVLDMGAGAGVIAVSLAKINTISHVTLCDINATALLASKMTLECNHVEGQVIASNVFSDISKRYDLIVSNPPFHEGIKTDYTATESLIREAKRHLIPGGHLCLVANVFLPYAALLDRFFGSHRVLKQTSKFKVYLAQHA